MNDFGCHMLHLKSRRNAGAATGACACLCSALTAMFDGVCFMIVLSSPFFSLIHD
jgi:hypothetical protein